MTDKNKQTEEPQVLADDDLDRVAGGVMSVTASDTEVTVRFRAERRRTGLPTMGESESDGV